MRTLTLLSCFASIAFAQSKLPPAANHKIDFEKDVQPILAQRCYSCHGEAAQQSGLRLDKRQNALRGGDYGPVMIEGKSAESKLIKRLVGGDGGLQMPPTGALADEEIGILRAWIDQGIEYRIQVHAEAATKPVDPKLAALIAAVRAGDAKSVAKQLGANPSLLHAVDADGSTPLHHAAGFGNLATMKLLLDKGADANAANHRKSTPLLWGMAEEAKVRLLLERGANVNQKNVDGRGPLYQAATMANAAASMKLLMEKGADVNAKTLTGMTPLIAASRMNAEAARLLLEHGADVNATNAAGGSALMAAASAGRAQVVRMLLDKGANPNARTKRKETALADAATAGNAETVKLLLNAGAKVNVQDIRGYSPLLYAAGSDAMPAEVVKMLLDQGADLSHKGDEESAAQLAAKRGNSEVARLLNVSEEQRMRLGVVPAPQGSGQQRAVADAVKPALALLEKQSHNFIRIGGCNSCHAQNLPSTAAAIARERGLPAPKEISQLPLSMHTQSPSRLMDMSAITVASAGWEMFDLGANGAQRDAYTDANVHYMKATQTAAGNWEALESRRPPMSAGTYQATALAAYTLKTFGMPGSAKELARAAAWLEAAPIPANTQDRAFHLLGLAWAGAKPQVIATVAKSLAGAQREDGGWNQLPTMGSDAYATGEALYALAAAGKMRPNDAVYAKGVKYLLTTQAPDGSWHVATRSIWLQPYFESGFPYGHDQWISAAGTAWATMALSMTVEPLPNVSKSNQQLARR